MTLEVITIPNENLRKRSLEVDLGFVREPSALVSFELDPGYAKT